MSTVTQIVSLQRFGISMSSDSLLPCFTRFPIMTWACALLSSAVTKTKGNTSFILALIKENGQGRGVLGFPNPMLCFYMREVAWAPAAVFTKFLFNCK